MSGLPPRLIKSNRVSTLMQLSENPKRLLNSCGRNRALPFPSRPNELASLASESFPCEALLSEERKTGTPEASTGEDGRGRTRDDYTARYSWGRVLEALEEAQRQQQKHCDQASKPVRSFVRFVLSLSPSPGRKSPSTSYSVQPRCSIDVAARCRGRRRSHPFSNSPPR